MQRRHLIIGAGLIAIIAAGLLAGGLVWRRHAQAAIAIAGVAPLPDLRRWPTELRQLIAQQSAAVKESDSPREHLTKLAELYCANGYKLEGERALAALRQLEPKNPRWPYFQADLRLRAGDQTGAEPALQATVELDPAYAPAWLRLGDLLASRGALGRARNCLARAVAIAPGSIRPEFTLISFDANHGNGGDATRHRLEELARAHPGIKEVHAFLADMLAAARDPEGAARERRLAETSDLALGTEDPWLDELDGLCYDSNRLMLRGVAMRREGRLPAAEKFFKKVVQLAPEEPANPLGWELLSDLYLKLNRPADARATLETAVAQFPDEPQMPLLLTRLLCTEHEPQAALAVIQRAVQRWPDQSELHEALGLAWHDAGNYSAAAAALREAVRLDPTMTEAQYLLGACLLKLGQRDAAHAAMEKTLAMRPDHPQALFAIAAIDLEAGQFAAAEPYVFKVYALDANEPNARGLVAAWHLLKGMAANQAGDADEADRQFRAGLAVAPDFVPLLRETGSRAVQRGRWPEAVETWERYLRVEPADPQGYLLLGTALQKIGRGADALAIFERGYRAAQTAGDQAKMDEFKRLLAR